MLPYASEDMDAHCHCLHKLNSRYASIYLDRFCVSCSQCNVHAQIFAKWNKIRFARLSPKFISPSASWPISNRARKSINQSIDRIIKTHAHACAHHWYTRLRQVESKHTGLQETGQVRAEATTISSRRGEAAAKKKRQAARAQATVDSDGSLTDRRLTRKIESRHRHASLIRPPLTKLIN